MSWEIIGNNCFMFMDQVKKNLEKMLYDVLEIIELIEKNGKRRCKKLINFWMILWLFFKRKLLKSMVVRFFLMMIIFVS